MITKSSLSSKLNSSKTWLIILILGTASFVCGKIGYSIHSHYQKYENSEQAIEKESRLLNLDLGEQTGREWRPGVCFDNCPETSYEYRLTKPQYQAELGESLKQKLEKHNYETNDGFYGNSPDREYSIVVYPNGSTSSIPETELVRTVRVDFTHSPR